MENKYYTPTTEEFCVGFEFEFETGIEGWKKFTFSKDRADRLLENVEDFSPQFRVKYLDKEDVKECGWEHDANDDGEEIPSLFEKHGYSLGFSIDQQMTPKDICYILYLFPDNFVIVDSIYKCGSGREEMLFRGEIKNKSELKKLMKQLNIQL